MAPMSSSGWSRRARRARQPFGCPWDPPRPAERLVRRATVDVDLERKLVSERMRVARQTDIELCVAAQTAAAARRELGSIAHLLLRLRLACPARIRGLWRWAIELASRMAGEPLSDWRGAEVIAAEGFSGRPDVAEVGERSLVACVRLPHGKRRSTGDAHTGGGAVGEVTP